MIVGIEAVRISACLAVRLAVRLERALSLTLARSLALPRGRIRSISAHSLKITKTSCVSSIQNILQPGGGEGEARESEGTGSSLLARDPRGARQRWISPLSTPWLCPTSPRWERRWVSDSLRCLSHPIINPPSIRFELAISLQRECVCACARCQKPLSDR